MIRFLLLLALLPFPAQAAEDSSVLALRKPVACTIGTDCWITHYPNVAAPGTPARDFKCGTQTYAESIGTDFALADVKARDTGMNVLAATGGTIINVRDGIPDAVASDEAIQKLRADKKACGNAVLIDHGNGWQSIYCHLRNGTIKVKKGDKVNESAVLAQVGQSGAAPLPQLHFGLFHNGKTIDPFTGLEAGNGCGGDGKPLWREDAGMSYAPASLYATGFLGSTPDTEILKQDITSPAELPGSDLSVFSFWGGIMGAAAGDKIALEVMRPDGTPYARKEFIQKESRIRQFYYIGRELKNPGQLEPGAYTGTVTLSRTLPDGTPFLQTATKTITLK